MDAVIDGHFSDNLIVPPVITQVLSDKLSESSVRDLYERCGVHLTTDTVNPLSPQFMTHGFSNINALNKGARIWIPDTRVRMTPDVTHCIMADHDLGQITAVEDSVGAKSDYSEENYKNEF